jgi:hypothetical protein
MTMTCSFAAGAGASHYKINVSVNNEIYFARHVKPLVPAAVVVDSTHLSALGPRRGLWPVLLMCDPLGRPSRVVGALIG